MNIIDVWKEQWPCMYKTTLVNKWRQWNSLDYHVYAQTFFWIRCRLWSLRPHQWIELGYSMLSDIEIGLYVLSLFLKWFLAWVCPKLINSISWILECGPVTIPNRQRDAATLFKRQWKLTSMDLLYIWPQHQWFAQICLNYLSQCITRCITSP